MERCRVMLRAQWKAGASNGSKDGAFFQICTNTSWITSSASLTAPRSHRPRASPLTAPDFGLQCQPRHAVLARKIVEAHDPAMNGNRLRRHSDVTAPDSPIAQQAAGNEFCGVDSDGETDSLRRKDGRGVDSDNLPARVDERASRISGV